MYSDAANFLESTTAVVTGNGHHVTEVFAPWRNWEPSRISHHGGMCCEIAREWLTSTDYASLNGDSVFTGPRWLRHRFKWGASTFPIYWCEVVRKKVLDCGALAALAHEAFIIRGVRSFPVQLVQRFSTLAGDQWCSSWNDGVPLRWINNDLIYHEGCAILVREDEVKVWDASAGWWINPKSSAGYGSLAAIKITAPAGRKPLRWGERVLTANEWENIEDERPAF